MSAASLRTTDVEVVCEPSDRALLEEIGRGDERAFEALFTRHYATVYGVVMRVVGDAQEAEEIAQDVFLKLYQRPIAPDGANVSGWLYRVATNAAFNAVRSRRRRLNWLRRFAGRREAREADADDPLEIVARRDEAERLRAYLERLPERQRTALILRASGMTYLEIAGATGVGVSSVGTILARGERALRAMLGGEDARWRQGL